MLKLGPGLRKQLPKLGFLRHSPGLRPLEPPDVLGVLGVREPRRVGVESKLPKPVTIDRVNLGHNLVASVPVGQG